MWALNGVYVYINCFLTDKLVASIEAELKRLQRRRLFNESQSSQFSPSSPHQSGKDQPLFNLKQVITVCQRMVKDREEQIREEYDKVLTGKLAGKDFVNTRGVPQGLYS